MLNISDTRHVKSYGKYKESNEIGRKEKKKLFPSQGDGILDNFDFLGLNKLELITET